MASDLPASFGRWLRQRRTVLDLTQETLARTAGCSVVTIRKLESDERRPSRQLVERLADILQIAPHERAAFIGLGRAEPADDAPAPLASLQLPLVRHPRTLPLPLTRLLGRKRELAALRSAVLRGDTRLLTLSGPPGVGKTRLALQAAADLRLAFADDVCFIPLASVQRPDLVLSALAQALDLRPRGPQPLDEQVTAYLQGKRMLLLLDNFEHVLDAAPTLVTLLERVPSIKALVTSRVALRVRGEHVVPLAPLPVPTLTGGVATHAVARNPAVALFVERARAVAPGFGLSDATVPLVAELCARLEGLPLALELVATRADQLSLPELLRGLEQRLALLSDGPRDLPSRHQSLRAAIAQSDALLGAEARTLFRRLSVFVGGWTVEAAEALWAATEHPGGAPLPQLLATLATHSLIQYGGAEHAPRFAMLETIRAYALEQLATEGEEADVRRAHLRYFRALAERSQAEQHGPQQVAWLDMLVVEHPNLRAALEWSLLTGEGDEALRLAGALGWFWFVRGFSAEGRRWLDLALAMESGVMTGWQGSATRASALAAAGHLALFAGDFAAARRLLEESVALWRTLRAQGPADQTARRGLAVALTFLIVAVQYQSDDAARPGLVAEYLALHGGEDDPRLRALFHFNLGRAALLQDGNHRMAQVHLEQSLKLLQVQGDLWTIGQVVVDLGLLALAEGEIGTARAHFEQGRALAQTLRDGSLLALAENNLGEAARAAGELEVAAAHYSASLQLHQELGNHTEVPRLLHNLGYVALRQDKQTRAADYFRESLRGFAQLGMVRGMAEAVAGFASLAAARRQGREAARLWAAAAVLRAREHTPIWPTDQREYVHYQALVREHLDAEQWKIAWDEGATQPLDIETLLGS